MHLLIFCLTSLADHTSVQSPLPHCSGHFLCFAGLPPAVLLLYWVRLSSAILGPSVLSKGVEIGPIGTQIGPACAQIMPRLPGACLRQVELF